MLKYKSQISLILQRLMFSVGYLLGIMEESQKIKIELAEMMIPRNVSNNENNKNVKISIPKDIHIYNSKIEAVANISGFTYIWYNWFYFTSFFLIVFVWCCVFTCSFFFSLFFYFCCCESCLKKNN